MVFLPLSIPATRHLRSTQTWNTALIASLSSQQPPPVREIVTVIRRGLRLQSIVQKEICAKLRLSANSPADARARCRSLQKNPINKQPKIHARSQRRPSQLRVIVLAALLLAELIEPPRRPGTPFQLLVKGMALALSARSLALIKQLFLLLPGSLSCPSPMPDFYGQNIPIGKRFNRTRTC